MLERHKEIVCCRRHQKCSANKLVCSCIQEIMHFYRYIVVVVVVVVVVVKSIKCGVLPTFNNQQLCILHTQQITHFYNLHKNNYFLTSICLLVPIMKTYCSL